jgi:hypothetical protein
VLLIITSGLRKLYLINLTSSLVRSGLEWSWYLVRLLWCFQCVNILCHQVKNDCSPLFLCMQSLHYDIMSSRDERHDNHLAAKNILYGHERIRTVLLTLDDVGRYNWQKLGHLFKADYSSKLNGLHMLLLCYSHIILLYM